MASESYFAKKSDGIEAVFSGNNGFVLNMQQGDCAEGSYYFDPLETKYESRIFEIRVSRNDAEP